MALRHTVRVQLVAKSEPEMTGMSRYARDLCAGLRAACMDVELTFPVRPHMPSPAFDALRRIGLDFDAFFATYPLRVELKDVDVFHFTSQMLATLLLFQSFPRPVVVTVLDIIPYLVRHQSELNTLRHPIDHIFYRFALAGLRRADRIVAISEYTRRTLVDTLGLPVESIDVVYPAVDHATFRPAAISDAFAAKYGLAEDVHYLLHVGSEDPRKNLPVLMQAFAEVKHRMGEVKLLKVGAPRFPRERERLLVLIAELNLQEDVRFFDYVPEEELTLFYNLADVVVLPSLYEGFGLPAAEAMACGTPVVGARAASLPEIIGNAGVQVPPHDVHAFADALCGLLCSPQERRRLGQAGRERVTRFSTERAASEIHAIYARLMECKMVKNRRLA